MCLVLARRSITVPRWVYDGSSPPGGGRRDRPNHLERLRSPVESVSIRKIKIEASVRLAGRLGGEPRR
jgi:hypothetical protein